MTSTSDGCASGTRSPQRTRGGLLVGGLVVPVPGCTTYNPLDTPWCRLHPRDYRTRKTKWIRQLGVHTTLGKWPQQVLLEPAPDGQGEGAKATADYWYSSSAQSAAPIVIDFDADVACLADVVTAAAFHGGRTNEYSIGIEIKQRANGAIHEAQLHALVAVCQVLCETLGIPFQVPADPYVPGRVIDRMKRGGPDCVGIFGHRDFGWYLPEDLPPEERQRFPAGRATRGRGDPGDAPYQYLIVAGAEPLRYGELEDLATWKRRQRKLNALGEQLDVDGLAGPGTIAAMRRRGFASGRELDAA